MPLVPTAVGDAFKANAFAKVTKILDGWPETITSSKDLKGIAGVGKGSQAKVGGGGGGKEGGAQGARACEMNGATREREGLWTGPAPRSPRRPSPEAEASGLTCASALCLCPALQIDEFLSTGKLAVLEEGAGGDAAVPRNTAAAAAAPFLNL